MDDHTVVFNTFDKGRFYIRVTKELLADMRKNGLDIAAPKPGAGAPYCKIVNLTASCGQGKAITIQKLTHPNFLKRELHQVCVWD